MPITREVALMRIGFQTNTSLKKKEIKQKYKVRKKNYKRLVAKAKKSNDQKGAAEELVVDYAQRLQDLKEARDFLLEEKKVKKEKKEKRKKRPYSFKLERADEKGGHKKKTYHFNTAAKLELKLKNNLSPEKCKHTKWTFSELRLPLAGLQIILSHLEKNPKILEANFPQGVLTFGQLKDLRKILEDNKEVLLSEKDHEKPKSKSIIPFGVLRRAKRMFSNRAKKKKPPEKYAFTLKRSCENADGSHSEIISTHNFLKLEQLKPLLEKRLPSSHYTHWCFPDLNVPDGATEVILAHLKCDHKILAADFPDGWLTDKQQKKKDKFINKNKAIVSAGVENKNKEKKEEEDGVDYCLDNGWFEEAEEEKEAEVPLYRLDLTRRKNDKSNQVGKFKIIQFSEEKTLEEKLDKYLSKDKYTHWEFSNLNLTVGFVDVVLSRLKKKKHNHLLKIDFPKDKLTPEQYKKVKRIEAKNQKRLEKSNEKKKKKKQKKHEELGWVQKGIGLVLGEHVKSRQFKLQQSYGGQTVSSVLKFSNNKQLKKQLKLEKRFSKFKYSTWTLSDGTLPPGGIEVFLSFLKKNETILGVHFPKGALTPEQAKEKKELTDNHKAKKEEVLKAEKKKEAEKQAELLQSSVSAEQKTVGYFSALMSFGGSQPIEQPRTNSEKKVTEPKDEEDVDLSDSPWFFKSKPYRLELTCILTNGKEKVKKCKFKKAQDLNDFLNHNFSKFKYTKWIFSKFVLPDDGINNILSCLAENGKVFKVAFADNVQLAADQAARFKEIKDQNKAAALSEKEQAGLFSRGLKWVFGGDDAIYHFDLKRSGKGAENDLFRSFANIAQLKKQIRLAKTLNKAEKYNKWQFSNLSLPDGGMDAILSCLEKSHVTDVEFTDCSLTSDQEKRCKKLTDENKEAKKQPLKKRKIYNFNLTRSGGSAKKSKMHKFYISDDLKINTRWGKKVLTSDKYTKWQFSNFVFPKRIMDAFITYLGRNQKALKIRFIPSSQLTKGQMAKLKKVTDRNQAAHKKALEQEKRNPSEKTMISKVNEAIKDVSNLKFVAKEKHLESSVEESDPPSHVSENSVKDKVKDLFSSGLSLLTIPKVPEQIDRVKNSLKQKTCRFELTRTLGNGSSVTKTFKFKDNDKFKKKLKKKLKKHLANSQYTKWTFSEVNFSEKGIDIILSYLVKKERNVLNVNFPPGKLNETQEKCLKDLEVRNKRLLMTVYAKRHAAHRNRYLVKFGALGSALSAVGAFFGGSAFLSMAGAFFGVAGSWVLAGALGVGSLLGLGLGYLRHRYLKHARSRYNTEEKVSEVTNSGEKTALKVGVEAASWKGYFASFRRYSAYRNPRAFAAGMELARDEDKACIQQIKLLR